MIKKRLILIVLLLPLALVLAFYLAWPVWVTPLVRVLLADADLELVQAEIHRPGWQGLLINDLKLRYLTDEYDSTLTVPNVSLGYSWQDLLRGQLQILQISQARLQLELLSDGAVIDENKLISEVPLLITELLPQKLFPQLPFLQLHVDSLQLLLPEVLVYQNLSGSFHYSDQQLQLKLRSLDKANVDLPTLQLNLELDQQNRLQLALLKNTHPIVVIASQIVEQTAQLEGELTLDLGAATELLHDFELLEPDYQLAGEAQLRWQLPVPDKIDSNDWLVTAHFQTQLTVNQFKQARLSAEALAFSATGQAHLSADILRLQFDAGSLMRAGKVKAPDFRVDSLVIKMPRAFGVILQSQQVLVPDLQLQLASTQLVWQAENYQFSKARVRLQDVSLGLQNPVQLSSHIDVSLTDFELPTNDLHLKSLDMQGSWQLAKEVLRGTVQLSYAGRLIKVDGEMMHNLNTGKGYLSAQMQRLTFRQTQSYLPRLFEAWPYPFDLFAGQLDMKTRLNWNAEKVSATGRLTLTDVAGFYDTNLFRGLNAELLIDGPVDNLKLTAKHFNVASVDVGVPIKNISFVLLSTTERLQLKDFQAELLGGQVSQRLVSYDWNQDQNDLVLQIQGIQLGELLNLETGIEGLGVLDGELPISISSRGIVIDQSEIKARSPGGFIKYQGAQAMSSAVADVGVGFALKALENFHYDVLNVKASYSEDGQLTLQTVLLGRNPDMKEQRPVRYNINIQENIPALIQSLKLTQQISDDIERRIQAFYKQG